MLHLLPSENLNGFLPSQEPAAALPEITEYQIQLNAIMRNLPALMKEKKLRETVDALNKEFPSPELQYNKLQKNQKDTALCFLTAIAQAYIFEDSTPIKHIPGTIAKPLYKLCKSRQRFPTFTYSDYVLNNWKLIDKSKAVSLDNIEPIYTFTALPDEAWFIKIHVVIEAVAAKAIRSAHEAMLESLRENPDQSRIRIMLDQITSSLEDVVATIHQMKDGCNPALFWQTLRPYLGGWEKVKPADCNDQGVRFEGVESNDNKPSAFSGPSGAQSSIIPALDAALKIKHNIDGMFKKLLEFKDYMPTQHQAMILQFANSKIKSVAKHSNDASLNEAYDRAVSAVKQVRGAHLALVHAYIYTPAAAQGIPADAITGTGGAPIKTYLHGRYNDTKTLGNAPVTSEEGHQSLSFRK
jgi:indoleamine 2,3-dioxygenase